MDNIITSTTNSITLLPQVTRFNITLPWVHFFILCSLILNFLSIVPILLVPFHIILFHNLYLPNPIIVTLNSFIIIGYIIAIVNGNSFLGFYFHFLVFVSFIKENYNLLFFNIIHSSPVFLYMKICL